MCRAQQQELAKALGHVRGGGSVEIWIWCSWLGCGPLDSPLMAAGSL